MEAGGDSASFDGYLRGEALLDYNLRQKRAQQLTTALGACQKARFPRGQGHRCGPSLTHTNRRPEAVCTGATN
jgi:hypothetical protein